MKNSQFVRNVATLMSGQAMAQLITIIATPVIARLFIPEDFGVVALFISIVTILSVPATFRYELATILPDQDSVALKLVVLAFIIVVVSCLVVLLLQAFVEIFNVVPKWLEPLGLWLWLVPFALFIRAGIKIVEGWATRKKQYKSMAVSDVGQAVTTTGSRIVFGFVAGTSVWGLMVGYVAGLILKFFTQLYYTRIPVFQYGKSEDKETLVQVGSKYQDFPKYNMPSGLIRTFAQNIPVIMFGVYFGPAVVGLYAMANRLFRMPVNFLSRAIRRVYLQKLSELKNKEQDLRPSFVKMTVALSALTLLPTFILWWLGADICVFFLGDNWVSAGVFVEILSPWLFTIIMATPATAIIVVCRKQHIWLRYNIVVTIMQLVGFIAAHELWANAEYALIVFVAIGIMANIYIMAYAYSVVTHNNSNDNVVKSF